MSAISSNGSRDISEIRGRIKKRERASSLFIAGYYKFTNCIIKNKSYRVSVLLSFVIEWQLKRKNIFKIYATRWKIAEGKVEVSRVSYGYPKRYRYRRREGRSGISWPTEDRIRGDSHETRDRESLGERGAATLAESLRTAHPVPTVSGLFSASTSLSVRVLFSPLLTRGRERETPSCARPTTAFLHF